YRRRETDTGQARAHDRVVRLRRRRRHPGRPEGVRRGGRARAVGDRRADGAVDGRRLRHRGAAARLRPRTARGRVRRHRRRRGEDGNALLRARDRDGRRLPARPSSAARRRSGARRELGRAAAGGRCRRRARLRAVAARDGRDAESRGGGGVRRRHGLAGGAGRTAARARRAGRDRHRRPRSGRRRPSLRRTRARRDPRRAPRRRSDPRRRVHALCDARRVAGEGSVARAVGARCRGGRLARGRPGARGARRGRGAGGRARGAGTMIAAGETLRTLRERKPLVHQITNYVVMNETANATLALGALPVMAHAVEEAEEMAGLASALVLNIGTLSERWVDAMLLAGERATARGIPIVLDPVGAGATAYRTETARRLLERLDVTVLRGNAGELATLV